MATIKDVISERRNDCIAKIDEYNAALKENDNAKMVKIEQELKENEAAYAEAKCEELFERLSKDENPVKAAITEHSYFVIAHKMRRGEGGVNEGFEIIEDKVRQIDLVKFCKYCHKDTDWQHNVEKFNQLLALRAANELKMTKAQIKKICDSFYMSRLAREVEMGGTPDSNTAICKQLQMIIDKVLYEDNGKGKNVYRANTHDVAYLLMCYTKRGKKVLSVSVAKNTYMHRLIFDIMHRVVTGKVYDLEYRMISDTKVVEAKAAAKAKSEEKAKADKKPENVETVVVEKAG